MKYAVTPFNPTDLSAIMANALGLRELAWHDRRQIEAQAAGLVRGFTVRDAASAEILFCGGAVEAHPQYARLWAVYAEGLGRKTWAFLLDRTSGFIAALPHRRVDTLVDARAPMALRWAEACGLQREGLMRAAGPDGGDMAIMMRIER